MGAGRVACVALPFILALASLISLMIACLAGVTNKNLYLFRIDTTDFEFNPQDSIFQNSLLTRTVDVDVGIAPRAEDPGLAPQHLVAREGNVTASDLGIAGLYDVSLWGYCMSGVNGRTCSNTNINWAEDLYNSILDTFRKASAIDDNFDLPEEAEDSLRAFSHLSKWTNVAYILALVALAVELLFGILASFSRIWGCVTFLVATVTSVLVIAAAGLSTALAVLAVGAAEATAFYYGLSGSINRSFLAAAWLGALFAVAAGFFWMFTVCCCATSHPSSKRGVKARSLDELEKNQPYQPLGEQHEMTPRFAGQEYGQTRPGVGPRASMAYEPYSHNNNA